MKQVAKGKRPPMPPQPPMSGAASASGISQAGCTSISARTWPPPVPCPGPCCRSAPPSWDGGEQPSHYTDKPPKCTQAIKENLFWARRKSALQMLPLSPQAEQQDQSQPLHSSDLASSGSAGTTYWISYKAHRPPRVWISFYFCAEQQPSADTRRKANLQHPCTAGR